jgi:hypothetical protein
VPSSPEGTPRPSGGPPTAYLLGPASGPRRTIEAASRPLLLWLVRLPRVVPFLVLLALLVGGLFVAGLPGATAAGSVALFVLWLLYLGWPRLGWAERLGRAAVLLIAVAMCLVQLFPRG